MPRGVTYTASAFFPEYAGVDARVSKFVDRDSAISNAPMSHSVERSSLIHIWVCALFVHRVIAFYEIEPNFWEFQIDFLCEIHVCERENPIPMPLFSFRTCTMRLVHQASSADVHIYPAAHGPHIQNCKHFRDVLSRK